MEIIIDVPDGIANRLRQKWHDMPRGVLARIALEGYRSRAVGEASVRRLLGFDTPV